jgi:hypothetical protein
LIFEVNILLDYVQHAVYADWKDARNRVVLLEVQAGVFLERQIEKVKKEILLEMV